MSRGLFISLEGGEGAGKSTQARRLAARISETGREVVVTREPGGSPGGEAIRALLVEGATERWSATTETLLMYAARRDHIERVIAPALERGAVVVCDRFADSTRAYQGAAGGAAESLIRALEQEVLGEVRPDVTLILDLPVDIGLERARARDPRASRFEQRDPAFHERLRGSFLSLSRSEPARCVVVDASAPLDDVTSQVWAAVAPRLAT